ncbi:ABC transporter substrate-binding protein [Sediminispirochaeta bajacaliforniensis]|uniref:ABC transporter substrate-binding protein n=1 Tax=Sediminispirochaeta bajacaliforniensis TaxID=148 RepID=UPI0003798F19|nr:ABC transporter substrate-binding protein [Sediminispirochaeta bajacaliforniensis]
MKKRFWLALCILMLMGVHLLLAQGNGEHANTETQPPKGSSISRGDRGNVLTIALSASPKNLDPIKYTGVYEGNIIRNVADTVVRYNKDLSAIVPSLATEWSVSDDGTVYTFKLRDDVYFQPGTYQDGKKMTAADVKFSLERSAEKSAMNRLGMLKSVEIVNDYEIKCHLDHPNAAFLTVLTDAGNVIVSPEDAKGWGESFGAHLVGTGAFSLSEFKPDQEAILNRFDHYWGPKPNLDGAIFKFITDAAQMTNALRSGEIDVATDLGGENVKVVSDDPNLVLDAVPGLHVAYVYMNLMHGPTADKRVREAIIKAIDINALIKGVYPYNEAQRAYLPLPPGSWGYDASLEKLIPSYDPEGAKSLLKDAGYPDGFHIDVYVANKPARVKMCTILQAYLKKNLNVDLEIKTAEWGTFSEVASSGKAGMYAMSWTWYPDPFFFLNKMFHSSEIGALGNGQGFNNPEVDMLLDKALTVPDLESRKVLYQKALKLIVSEYPRIDYSNEKVIYGFNPSVKGFVVTADNSIDLVSPEVNVYLED